MKKIKPVRNPSAPMTAPTTVPVLLGFGADPTLEELELEQVAVDNWVTVCVDVVRDDVLDGIDGSTGTKKFPL